MEKIYKNDALLELVYGSYLIHDSSVTRFDIYLCDYQLCIDVYFESIIKSDKQLKVHFIGVTEYELSWDKNYSFFTIERYKFFKSEKGFYISFNPYDESVMVLDDDADIIFCNEVEGYFL